MVQESPGESASGVEVWSIIYTVELSVTAGPECSPEPSYISVWGTSTDKKLAYETARRAATHVLREREIDHQLIHTDHKTWVVTTICGWEHKWELKSDREFRCSESAPNVVCYFPHE